jgi:hypothetical protein
MCFFLLVVMVVFFSRYRRFYDLLVHSLVYTFFSFTLKELSGSFSLSPLSGLRMSLRQFNVSITPYFTLLLRLFLDFFFFLFTSRDIGIPNRCRTLLSCFSMTSVFVCLAYRVPFIRRTIW